MSDIMGLGTRSRVTTVCVLLPSCASNHMQQDQHVRHGKASELLYALGFVESQHIHRFAES